MTSHNFWSARCYAATFSAATLDLIAWLGFTLSRLSTWHNNVAFIPRGSYTAFNLIINRHLVLFLMCICPTFLLLISFILHYQYCETIQSGQVIFLKTLRNSRWSWFYLCHILYYHLQLIFKCSRNTFNIAFKHEIMHLKYTFWDNPYFYNLIMNLYMIIITYFE